MILSTTSGSSCNDDMIIGEPVDYKVKTHRFQVAVYNVLRLQEPQAPEQRGGEAPDEAQAEALVVVLLYQLVQVDAGKGWMGELDTEIGSLSLLVPFQCT